MSRIADRTFPCTRAEASPDAVADAFAASVSPGGREAEPTEAYDLHGLAGDRDALVVIRRPGRYALTRHLIGPRGRHGIRIVADDVIIDLRGHALIGAEYSRDGLSLADSVCNVRIANGSIRSWGGVGADLAGAIRVRLDNLRVFDNVRGALRLGPSAVLTDCVIGGDIRSGIDAMLPAG